MSWHYSDQWAAGFFDGEGCVSISKRQRTAGFVEHFLSVQVGQREKAPLDALAREHGGRVVDGHRPLQFFRWRVHGQRAQLFLERITPHLLVKRGQAEAALELRAAIGCPGKRMRPGAWEAKERAYKHWREAKHGVALPA